MNIVVSEATVYILSVVTMELSENGIRLNSSMSTKTMTTKKCVFLTAST